MPTTWPDFETLFTRAGNAWNACGCMLCHRGRHLSRSEFPARAGRVEQNLREHRELVQQGRALGILVYRDRATVGWCQFGPALDFSPAPPGDDPADPLWRITCFVTDKRFRGQGVAQTALRAAIGAVRERGGGVIEARPLADDVSWAYSGTLRLFAAEGFEEVRRFVVNSEPLPRYDRNRVTAGKEVVVVRLTLAP